MKIVVKLERPVEYNNLATVLLYANGKRVGSRFFSSEAVNAALFKSVSAEVAKAQAAGKFDFDFREIGKAQEELARFSVSDKLPTARWALDDLMERCAAKGVEIPLDDKTPVTFPGSSPPFSSSANTAPNT